MVFAEHTIKTRAVFIVLSGFCLMLPVSRSKDPLMPGHTRTERQAEAAARVSPAP